MSPGDSLKVRFVGTIASFHAVDPVAAYLMIPTQVWRMYK